VQTQLERDVGINALGLIHVQPQGSAPRWAGADFHGVLRRSAATKEDKKKEAGTEDFGLVRVRQLDTSATKPAPVMGIAARIGVPPPAGFGLDLLPGINNTAGMNESSSLDLDRLALTDRHADIAIRIDLASSPYVPDASTCVCP
jgi:hypothetical protein